MTRAGVYRCMNEHCVTYREPDAAPGRCSSCGEYRLAPPDARPIIWIDGVPVDVDTVLAVATELRDAGALPVYSPSDADIDGATWEAEPDIVHPSDAGCDAMTRALLQHERSLLFGLLFARIDYLGSVVCDVPPLWVSDWNHSPTKLDRGDSLVPATPLDELWRKR